VSLALPSPYACPCSPLPVSSLRRNESCGGNDHTRRRNFPDTRAKPTHPTIGQCETVWMGTGPSSASGVHAHPPPSTHSSPGGRVRVAPRTLHVPLDRIQGGGEGTGRDGRTDPLLSLSPLVVPVLVKERQCIFVGKWQVNNVALLAQREREGKEYNEGTRIGRAAGAKATASVCPQTDSATTTTIPVVVPNWRPPYSNLFPSIHPPIKFLPLASIPFYSMPRSDPQCDHTRTETTDQVHQLLPCLVYLYIKSLFNLGLVYRLYYFCSFYLLSISLKIN
jgi:hypothetical protein